MRQIILSLLFVCSFFSCNYSLFSQSSFGLQVGLATPSEKLNQIYNEDLLKVQNALGVLLREGPNTGYIVNAKLRFELDEKVWFNGGAGIARFPQSVIPIVNQIDNKDTLAIMTSIQNIIPLSAGLHYQFNRGLVSLYFMGDMTYNYMMNSVDVKYNKQSFPLPPKNETISRIGIGFGAGLDFHIPIFTGNLEAKYNIVNFIGRDPIEAEKSYFTLTLGVYFGETQSAIRPKANPSTEQ